MLRKLLTIVAATATLSWAANLAAPATWAASLPSGEVQVGRTVIEPAYDDMTGSLVYLSTPMGPTVHPTSHNVAPIYLPVYPVGAPVGVLNCMHTPTENCPDHGGLIAGLAMGTVPSVYGGGVLGHDHLVGIASTGGDFNVLWEPVVVLFTDPAAAQQHVTLLSQVEALKAQGKVREIPLPPATFHCSVVSGAVYAHGVPFTG